MLVQSPRLPMTFIDSTDNVVPYNISGSLLILNYLWTGSQTFVLNLFIYYTQNCNFVVAEGACALCQNDIVFFFCLFVAQFAVLQCFIMGINFSKSAKTILK